MFGMVGMAGGGGQSGTLVAQPVQLLSAGADSTVGSATWTDSGNVQQITVPAEATGIKNQISTQPDFKVWQIADTTVADLKGKEVGLRLSNFTLPSGSNAEILITFGIAFDTTAAFTRSTVTSQQGWIRIGNNGGANTVNHVGTTYDNQSMGVGTNIGTVDSAQLRFRVLRDGRRTTWFLETLDTSPGTDDERLGQKTDTLTDSENVYVFIGISRTDVNATTPQVSFEAEFLPATADWSET
jgi:hypothetical protein